MSNNKSVSVTNLQCDKNFVVRLRSVIEKHLIESGIIKGMLTPADEYSSKGDQAFGKFINSFDNNTIKELNLAAPTSPTSIPDTSSLKEGEVVYVPTDEETGLSVCRWEDLPDKYKWGKVTNVRPITIPSSSKELGSSREVEGDANIKKIVLDEYSKGNIVVATFEGLQTMPLKEFVKQHSDGILYDLNRNEATVLTFIKDPKWVNDYAVAAVIRELKRQIDEPLTTPDTIPSKEYTLQEVQELLKKQRELCSHALTSDIPKGPIHNLVLYAPSPIDELFLQSKNIEK